MWTNDPVADFNRYDREQAEMEKKLPHCDYCDCVIYEEYYYINGETLCEECLNDNFKLKVEIE